MYLTRGLLIRKFLAVATRLSSARIRQYTLAASPLVVSMSASTPNLVQMYSWKIQSPNARVLYLTTVAQANVEVAKLNSGYFGFDLEWRPTFIKGLPQNPVALVQIANDNTLLLIQVSAMPEFPYKLKEFLESEDFVKAGVGIKYDTQKLYQDWGVSMRSCVDLSLLARSVDNARWKGKYTSPISLSRLAEAYQGKTLQKGRITRSNWEATLSEKQIEYASNDAHAGYAIFKKLLAMSKTMEKEPHSICYTFNLVQGIPSEPSGIPWNPCNPDYDPGPPPPTPERAAHTAKKSVDTSHIAAASLVALPHRQSPPIRKPSDQTAQNTHPRPSLRNSAPDSSSSAFARGRGRPHDVSDLSSTSQHITYTGEDLRSRGRRRSQARGFHSQAYQNNIISFKCLTPNTEETSFI